MALVQTRKTQNLLHHHCHQARNITAQMIQRDRIRIHRVAALPPHHCCSQIQLVVSELLKYSSTAPTRPFTQLETIDDSIHLRMEFSQLNKRFLTNLSRRTFKSFLLKINLLFPLFLTPVDCFIY